MASRRARSRKDAEAAKWVAWTADDPAPWDLSKTTADFDTSDGFVDEMDVSEDEQYVDGQRSSQGTRHQS